MSQSRTPWEDVPDSRRRIMRAIRSRNTKPEVAVRSLLHAQGYRFRLHRRDLPGCPDLVFPARGKVVFVHGCFWHRHGAAGCPNSTLPATRAEWWAEKLEGNRRRDRRNAKALKCLGWESAVVWECQLKRPAAVTRRLRRFLGEPGAGGA